MDPISIQLLTAAGGRASGDRIFGFQVTDTSATGSVALWAQATADGTIYGATNKNIFKVKNYGPLAWQTARPAFYATQTDSKLTNIAVSQNGQYVIVGGNGGALGSSGSSLEAGITRINPASGAPIRTFKSRPSTVDSSADVKDIVVNNNGICNAVGAHRGSSNGPMQEYLRLCVDFQQNAILVNHGSTGGTYMEQWYDVDQNDTTVAMCGLDGQRPQVAYQQYNWSAYGISDATSLHARTYQTSGANGVFGQGVAVDPVNSTIYAGYRNYLGYGGIMHISSNGTISNRRRIYRQSQGDYLPMKVATDGVNIYLAATNYQTNIIAAISVATGATVWSNLISHYSGSVYVSKLRYNAGTNSLDTTLVPGQAGVSAYFSLPVDGSMTGTYGQYTYSPVSIVNTSASESWYYASLPTLGNWLSTSDVETSTASTNLGITTY